MSTPGKISVEWVADSSKLKQKTEKDLKEFDDKLEEIKEIQEETIESGQKTVADIDKKVSEVTDDIRDINEQANKILELTKELDNRNFILTSLLKKETIELVGLEQLSTELNTQIDQVGISLSDAANFSDVILAKINASVGIIEARNRNIEKTVSESDSRITRLENRLRRLIGEERGFRQSLSATLDIVRAVQDIIALQRAITGKGAEAALLTQISLSLALIKSVQVQAGAAFATGNVLQGIFLSLNVIPAITSSINFLNQQRVEQQRRLDEAAQRDQQFYNKLRDFD